MKELDVEEATKVEATVLRAIHLKNQRKLDEALDVVGSALENSEAWLMLGKINWETGDYSHSLMAFLKGIHADPYNWECLVYLGQYYQRNVNDIERSRKCYQKALQINPNSEQAGIGLSTAYRLLKNGVSIKTEGEKRFLSTIFVFFCRKQTCSCFKESPCTAEVRNGLGFSLVFIIWTKGKPIRR